MKNHLVEVYDLKNSEDVVKCINHTLNQSNLKNINQVIVSNVSKQEIKELNNKYRNKNKPANILSFNSNINISNDLILLGELVVCEEVLKEEACIQNKIFKNHLMHIVMHGTLHLLGFDHETKVQALEMESFEVELLKEFNISDPYHDE